MSEATSFEGISASARSEAQLLAIIEKIDLRIYNFLSTDAPLGTKYRVGDREMDHNGYLEWLLESRRVFDRALSALPAWEVTVYEDPDL